MSEERKMVLQMLADGKISVAEADTLLQALQEGEPSSQPAAAGRKGSARSLGELVQQALQEADRALDEAVRTVEERVAEQAQREPYKQIIALRRSIDPAAEKQGG